MPRPSDLIVGPLFLRCSPPIQPTSRLRDKDPRQRTSSRLLLSSPSPFSILYTPDQPRPTDLLLLFGAFLETTLFLRQLALSFRPTLQSNGRLSITCALLVLLFKSEVRQLGLNRQSRSCYNSLPNPSTFISLVVSLGRWDSASSKLSVPPAFPFPHNSLPHHDTSNCSYNRNLSINKSLQIITYSNP